MKTKKHPNARILRCSLFLFFAIFAIIINIYFLIGSDKVYGVQSPPHIYEFDDLQCYDEFGNFLGMGFYCEWSGNECWSFGWACPPDW